MSIVLSQSDSISNKQLQKFISETTELLKVSVTQGMNARMAPNVYKAKLSELKVGGKKKISYLSAAQVVAKRLEAVSAEKQRAVRLSLGRSTELTRTIRALGVNMEATKAVVDQVDLKQKFSFINGDTFSEKAMLEMVRDLSLVDLDAAPSGRELLAHDLQILERKFEFLPANWWKDIADKVKDADKPKPQVVLNKGLKFRIHEVKCIVETAPSWPGSDEISWGGASVDDKGTVEKLAEKYVGGDFDGGDRKAYNPPHVLKTFALDNEYAKDFMITLALAEKDGNGMSAFIQELYESIKAEINVILTALGAAAGAAIGTAIGGSLGTAIAGPLGTIIGVVAGAILGALIGWLVGLFQDDIFEPQAAALHLPNGNATFAGGSLTSPKQYLHFRDHGGHYRVAYDWQITR
ncbi:MAG TPA: hypothetical protein VFV39_11900 [Limnobacter sp.]|nr:hypothetical protein [Limnobacter sp.]